MFLFGLPCIINFIVFVSKSMFILFPRDYSWPLYFSGHNSSLASEYFIAVKRRKSRFSDNINCCIYIIDCKWEYPLVHDHYNDPVSSEPCIPGNNVQSVLLFVMTREIITCCSHHQRLNNTDSWSTFEIYDSLTILLSSHHTRPSLRNINLGQKQ